MYQQTIGATYYRGGSSKAIFLLEDDIPPPGELRDALLKRLIGSPDPLQIDGMGGSRVVTSKVAIIKKTSREDADVDYTFAQVGITTDTIGYGGNCGNISSAVGPFAIEAGLIHKFRPGVPTLGHENTQEVRIFVTGTKSILVAHVPVDRQTGKVVEDGDFAIAGVPGTGAPILMDYSAVSSGRISCAQSSLLTVTCRDNRCLYGQRIVADY
jgi:2-methylaconitate cis-trans-isomerase PrpF